MDWNLLQKHNGLGHSGNMAKGDPNAFTIVGIDETYESLAALVAEGDEKSLAILKRGGRDVARLTDDLPDQWINGFDLTGETNPIHFWQFVDKNGHSHAIVTDGRSRVMACRIVNKRRVEEKRPLIKLEAEPDSYLSAKGAEKRALRLKRIRNRSIPDSLCVLAESAGEFAETGLDVAGVAEEMGVTEDRAEELLKWAKVLGRLCDSAMKFVNSGKLRYGGAVRLANKYPSKEDQANFLAGKQVNRREQPAQRPLSPRTLDLFTKEILGHPAGPAHRDVTNALAVIRLVAGDKSAAKDLPEAVRSAWLRAEEASKKKPRKDASA